MKTDRIVKDLLQRAAKLHSQGMTVGADQLIAAANKIKRKNSNGQEKV